MGFAVTCVPAAVAGCFSFTSIGVFQQMSSNRFEGSFDVGSLTYWILMGTITGIALAAIHSVAGMCATLGGGFVLVFCSLRECSDISDTGRLFKRPIDAYLESPHIRAIALTILGASCGYMLGSI